MSTNSGLGWVLLVVLESSGTLVEEGCITKRGTEIDSGE